MVKSVSIDVYPPPPCILPRPVGPREDTGSWEGYTKEDTDFVFHTVLRGEEMKDITEDDSNYSATRILRSKLQASIQFNYIIKYWKIYLFTRGAPRLRAGRGASTLKKHHRYVY